MLLSTVDSTIPPSRHVLPRRTGGWAFRHANHHHQYLETHTVHPPGGGGGGDEIVGWVGFYNLGQNDELAGFPR